MLVAQEYLGYFNMNFNFVRHISILILATLYLNGCGLGYIIKSGVRQASILNKRVPIDEALKNPKIDSEKKGKLKLALAAKTFAENKLGLKRTKNYTSFVELNHKYVSYIVRAAKSYELEPHLWWFPIIGSVPYKGFPTKEEAKEEASQFDPLKFDTYVRGVTAYSTLGWFDDPVLSSMLVYEDIDLVNLIIHETVHATVYIKNNSDFNERLATFIGNLGTKLFYTQLEGSESSHLLSIDNDISDDKVFSQFISQELKDLKSWYKENSQIMNKELKKQRIKKINENFNNNVVLKLKTKNYSYFSKLELNNARLLSFSTYLGDLDIFDQVYASFNGIYGCLIQFFKSRALMHYRS